LGVERIQLAYRCYPWGRRGGTLNIYKLHWV
jgi:hypothetical protein